MQPPASSVNSAAALHHSDITWCCVCGCSVHSQQKHQIASRLVLGAQHVAYQQRDVRFAGPWPTGYALSSSSSTLRLSFNSSDLYVHNQHRYVGFEVRRPLQFSTIYHHHHHLLSVIET